MKSKASLFLSVFCLLLSFILSGCSSSKVANESSRNDLILRKRTISDALTAASQKPLDFVAYDAKLSQVSISFEGNEVNKIKGTIGFVPAGKTQLSARLSFPPISVGQIELLGNQASVKSTVANIDKKVKLPLAVNDYLQTALVGIIPPFYKLFAEDDFYNFDIYVNAKGQYVLQRNKGGVYILVTVNPDNYSLNSFTIYYQQYSLSYQATDFETVGNFYVPNKLFCNLRDSNTNKVSSVNLELNKITRK